MAEFMHHNVFCTFFRYICKPCVKGQHACFRCTAAPPGFHPAIPDFRHFPFAACFKKRIVSAAEGRDNCLTQLSFCTPAELWNGRSPLPQLLRSFKRMKDHFLIGSKQSFNLFFRMMLRSRNVYTAVRPDTKINVLYLLSFQLVGYFPSA